MLRELLDLSLYLVTDTALCGPAGVAGTVATAAGAGVTAVQLRDPGADGERFVELGREVVGVLRGTGVPLFVNDRVDLVSAIGADGAHIGQGDTDPVRARELLGPDAVLGLSVQTPAQLATAREYGDDVLDYLGVGPVWPQRTKPDAAEPGGLDRMRAIVVASPWPCVAIGGIDAARAAQVRRTGAAGVAVVSAVCGQPDVGAAVRRLRAAWTDDGGCS